jgi:hypothetical protein
MEGRVPMTSLRGVRSPLEWRHTRPAADGCGPDRAAGLKFNQAKFQFFAEIMSVFVQRLPDVTVIKTSKEVVKSAAGNVGCVPESRSPARRA